LAEEEGNNRLLVGPISASLVYNSSRIPDSDLSVITHNNRLTILDEYFLKSVTGLGLLDSILVPELLILPGRVTLLDSPAILTASSSPDTRP
jgi:hypothetical protein